MQTELEPYANLGRDSAILRYGYGNDFIIVEFRSWAFTLYTYTYESAGAPHIENMKRLADTGEGLNSYISRHKPPYQSKD